MFGKKKIDIDIQDEELLLVIIAIRKNKCFGRINCVKENEKITIGDIRCKKNNKGYGSAMMLALIDYAKQNEIEYIEGWLSNADKDHIERLYHFYQKFGFEIIPCEKEVKMADIKLIL